MNKRLYKSKTDKMLCGICGGLGEYFNVDPTLIRLLWVGISLITGGIMGLIAYIICAFIVPEDKDYSDGIY